MVRSEAQGQVIELWGEFSVYGAELTEVKAEQVKQQGSKDKRRRLKSSD